MAGLHINDKSPAFFKNLIAAAKEWKKQEKIFWTTELTDSELYQLQQTGGYADFVKLLLEDKTLREDFFLWVLRDGLPVDVYIQFPAMHEKITRNSMRGRISRMGQDFLKMRKVDRKDLFLSQQKLVTLPFEGQEISLLDENREVVFKGNYKVKIKEIFRVFRDKLRTLAILKYSLKVY